MWNDRRLARRAARGDSDAFAAIFRRYEQDLYRYCVAILGDPQEAQDALQNTMVKALRALPGERREVELKPWLYRVAHNESIELHRRSWPSEPLAEELPATVASVEETAADRVRLRELLADIGELPERHRGALVMRELAGLDFEEIGVALDTSPRAARQVLYEARRGLQQMSEGREMECDAVTALLSDQDGRVARRRDLCAHLRDCPGCRRFADGIGNRSETLAGIAPLPAIAAAAMLKGALVGTASGGGAAAGGSAAGVGGGAAGGASGGALGVASGAAKVASTGAILKSAVAVVAAVAVGGAVAVDQGHLLGDGGSTMQSGRPAPLTRANGEALDAVPSTTSAGVADRPHRAFKSGDVEKVGLKRPVAAAAKAAVVPHPDPTASRPATTAVDTDASASPGHSGEAPGVAKADRKPSRAAHPVHPDHPAHPSHPVHPAKPAHSAKPAHPAHPSHPEGAKPAANSDPETKAGTGAETGKAAAAGPKAVEPREGPAPSITPAEETSAEEAGAGEAAESPGKPRETPGRGR